MDSDPALRFHAFIICSHSENIKAGAVTCVAPVTWAIIRESWYYSAALGITWAAV